MFYKNCYCFEEYACVGVQAQNKHDIFFKFLMRQCFFSSNAGEVRCIFTQTKQLSLNLHPTHMVKTKEKHIPLNSKNHILNTTWTTWCTYVLVSYVKVKEVVALCYNRKHSIFTLFSTCTNSIIHPFYPPQNREDIVSDFSWDIFMSQGKLQTMNMQYWGGGGVKEVCYGICASRE